jgi:hypothetical protein
MAHNIKIVLIVSFFLITAAYLTKRVQGVDSSLIKRNCYYTRDKTKNNIGNYIVQNGRVTEVWGDSLIAVIRPLDTNPYSSIVGYAINDKLQVVGRYNDYNAPTSQQGVYFIWENGVTTLIDQNGPRRAQLTDINNWGVYVGYRDASYATGVDGNLGTGYVMPNYINDNGEVTGNALIPVTFDSHRFYYYNHVITDLDALGAEQEAIFCNETLDPQPTPLPSATPSPSPSPTPTPTPTPTPSPTPTPTASPTLTPSPTASPTPSATPEVSPTLIPTQTPLPSPLVPSTIQDCKNNNWIQFLLNLFKNQGACIRFLNK